MNSGIYRIINTINGHCYIGSAINLKTRKRIHFWSLNKNRHINCYLQNAFNLYKESSFIFDIIENCEKEKLIEREQFWIDSYKLNGEVLYNICPIAGNRLGTRHSNETIKLISKTKSESKQYLGENNPFYGKHHTEATKKIISEKSKNRICSKETRIKLSNVAKGRHPSRDAKQKMSDFAKTRTYSEATREKMSKSAKRNWELKKSRIN
jgi:group I intron endonuclease